MQLRLFKLRFRRRFQHGQKQVEDLGQQAEASLEQHFFKRLSSLGGAWRFITTWIALLVLIVGCLVVQIEGLSSHYQRLQPIPGGTYTEGVLGTFTNANPLYATSDADSTVSRLLFTGLMKYNDQNHLVGSLASGWDVDEKGTVYTVHLKPHLTWQDGTPLTADDVMFTYQAIQNPDAQSPLASSWQGIKVAKKDATTITFTLPTPLSSFPYSLTNGIVPAHAFANLPPTEWRSADFNSVHPVGNGPFMWNALQVIHNNATSTQVLIALQPFADYVGGKPKLDSFVVHVFSDKDELVKSFRNQQLTAIALPSPPADLVQDSGLYQYSFLLSAATMAFFNTSSGVLADTVVRQALVQSSNTMSIMSKLGYVTRAVREPLLKGQLGYDPAAVQAAYNPAAAKAALDKDGWLVGTGGVRSKAGKPLEVTFDASNSSEYAQVAHQLQADWQAVGVKVNLRLEQDQDFQNSLANRDYDAVLYSISIGVDPDVFVYWDSSQTDPRSTRLNLSSYKSAAADASLEAGRTRLDPTLRAVKYKPFLQAWQQDAPALGLYQPRYVYITNANISGLTEHTINTGTDRFNNVQNWMIRTAKVTNQ
jgi:peptide/nickel transport system substrate-binding protein